MFRGLPPYNYLLMNDQNNQLINKLRKKNQQLEKELEELQNDYLLLEKIMTNKGVLAWTVNTDFEFTFLSPEFVERYHQLTSNHIKIGQNAISSFHGKYKTIWKDRLARAINGESFVVDELIERKQENKYYKLFISPVKINGKTEGAQVVIHEIVGLEKGEKEELSRLLHLRSILDQLQDLYYEVGLDGEIKELSPAISRFTEYTREDLIGKNVLSLYKNNDARKALIETIAREGSIKDYIIELIDKDGTTKSISINANLVFDTSNFPTKIVGIMRDITDIEQKNKDLRWLRRAIEHSPMSIIITDIKGNIEYSNPFFSKVTGYTSEEVHGKNPSILKSGKQSETFYKEMWGTIKNGNIWEGEFYNKRKDDSFFYERAIISPVKDKNGEIVNFIAIKEDISASKQTLNEVKRLKSLNDRIINTMREGIVVENSEGNILFTNPEFCQMTGFDNNELAGEKWDVVIDHELHKNIQKNKNNQPGQRNELFESRLYHKNGTSIPVIVSGSPILDGRKYMGFISVFTDITQLKENEKKLKIALEQAQMSDKLKSAFLANMSHEIRTPMNAILGFTDILRQEKNLEEDVRDEYFAIIEKKGNELMQIISDLIDISKIEAKMVVINKREIPVNSFLEEIYHTFEKELLLSSKPSLKAKKSLPPNSESIIISTDPNRLRQVITNLLDNATKFTAKGEITLGYTVQKKFVEFFVQDTGIGISEANQKIIFERFRQVDDNFNRQFRGTGLGLNICKGLINLMGGDLYVNSKENQGTTFYFTLPLVTPK